MDVLGIFAGPVRRGPIPMTKTMRFDLTEQMTLPRQVTDLTGMIFVRLTVIRWHGRDANGKILWQCRCECGLGSPFLGTYLRTGTTKSCGCLRRDMAAIKKYKHGLGQSPEMTVWCSMIQRCHNSNHIHYRYYGGRGIRVCTEWKDSFKQFHDDMGPRPTPHHQLDRIDNSVGYSAKNCRWATRNENCRNRRGNRLIEYNGETKTIAEWAELIGMRTDTLKRRIYIGWDVKRAITTPLRHGKRNVTV